MEGEPDPYLRVLKEHIGSNTLSSNAVWFSGVLSQVVSTDSYPDYKAVAFFKEVTAAPRNCTVLKEAIYSLEEHKVASPSRLAGKKAGKLADAILEATGISIGVKDTMVMMDMLLEKFKTRLGSKHTKNYQRIDAPSRAYLNLGIRLGSGRSATVYKGVSVATERAVAIKHIDFDSHSDSDGEKYRREYALLQKFDHPNIVGLYDVIHLGNEVFLVMELCDTDLESHLRGCPGQQLEGSEVVFFTQQLAQGMKFLRSHKVVHRDLKPANLLLKRPGGADCTPTLKIADFGVARTLNDRSVMETYAGTPVYMAPELLTYGPYTSKVDLWSAGCIIYRMLVGHVPYNEHSPSLLIRAMKDERKVQLQIRKSALRGTVDPQLIKLIEGLLQRKPSERMSWEEFFSFPLLREAGKVADCARDEELVQISADIGLLDVMGEAGGGLPTTSPTELAGRMLGRLKGDGVDPSSYALVEGLHSLMLEAEVYQAERPVLLARIAEHRRTGAELESETEKLETALTMLRKREATELALEVEQLEMSLSTQEETLSALEAGKLNVPRKALEEDARATAQREIQNELDRRRADHVGKLLAGKKMKRTLGQQMSRLNRKNAANEIKLAELSAEKKLLESQLGGLGWG